MIQEESLWRIAKALNAARDTIYEVGRRDGIREVVTDVLKAMDEAPHGYGLAAVEARLEEWQARIRGIEVEQ